MSYVGRGGEKLAWALDHFGVDVAGRVCCDLGSHVGGFVDALLQAGAARVHAVDTSYGTLAWALRNDPRVEVLERTNALHVTLPEQVDLVTSDVGWTRQEKVLRSVIRQRREGQKALIGFMLESNIGYGRQEIPDNLDELQYGVSVTDPCLDWDASENALRWAHAQLANVVGAAAKR